LFLRGGDEQRLAVAAGHEGQCAHGTGVAAQTLRAVHALLVQLEQMDRAFVFEHLVRLESLGREDHRTDAWIAATADQPETAGRQPCAVRGPGQTVDRSRRSWTCRPTI